MKNKLTAILGYSSLIALLAFANARADTKSEAMRNRLELAAQQLPDARTEERGEYGTLRVIYARYEAKAAKPLVIEVTRVKFHRKADAFEIDLRQGDSSLKSLGTYRVTEKGNLVLNGQLKASLDFREMLADNEGPAKHGAMIIVENVLQGWVLERGRSESLYGAGRQATPESELMEYDGLFLVWQ